MTTSPNAPVFPEQWLDKPQFNDVIPTLCSKGGMTKRELFAALAMQAILAGCYTNPKAEEIPSEWVSDQALEHADALIDALNEEGQAITKKKSQTSKLIFWEGEVWELVERDGPPLFFKRLDIVLYSIEVFFEACKGQYQSPVPALNKEGE